MASFQPQQQKVVFTFSSDAKRAGAPARWVQWRKPSQGRARKASFATAWIPAIQSDSSAEKTDVNLAHTLLSHHQYALIKHDKNTPLEINLWSGPPGLALPRRAAQEGATSSSDAFRSLNPLHRVFGRERSSPPRCHVPHSIAALC